MLAVHCMYSILFTAVWKVNSAPAGKNAALLGKRRCMASGLPGLAQTVSQLSKTSLKGMSKIALTIVRFLVYVYLKRIFVEVFCFLCVISEVRCAV